MDDEEIPNCRKSSSLLQVTNIQSNIPKDRYTSYTYLFNNIIMYILRATNGYILNYIFFCSYIYSNIFNIFC